MTKEFAYQILGLRQDAPMDEVRRKEQEVLKVYEESPYTADDTMYGWLREAVNCIADGTFDGREPCSSETENRSSADRTAVRQPKTVHSDRRGFIVRRLEKKGFLYNVGSFDFLKRLAVVGVLALFLHFTLQKPVLNALIVFTAYCIVLNRISIGAAAWFIVCFLLVLGFSEFLPDHDMSALGLGTAAAVFAVWKMILTFGRGFYEIRLTRIEYRDGLTKTAAVLAVLFSLAAFIAQCVWFALQCFV